MSVSLRTTKVALVRVIAIQEMRRLTRRLRSMAMRMSEF